MSLINEVVTALRKINPRTHVSRLEDMLEITITESPPLCVLAHRYHQQKVSLIHVVTSEMLVLHALAKQNVGVVSQYLTARAEDFASPSCVYTDTSVPFVWYAQALVEKFKQNPNAEKWQWLSKVIQRNLLETACPKAVDNYLDEETVHFHVYASESEVVAHSQSTGVYVCATPTHIYVITPLTRERYLNQRLGNRIREAVESMKAPRLSMHTMIEGEQKYDICIVRGGHPLYEAALAVTSGGIFELKGCAPMTDASIPASFTPPTKQSEAVFLFAFDSSGKGVYDFRQPQYTLNQVSVSILDQ